MRTRVLLSFLLVPLLALGGCASDDEDALASDACELLEDAVAQGPEGLRDEERMAEFQERSDELEERAEGAEISEEEMDQAIREECPEVFDELEGMFMEPGQPPDGDVTGEPGDDGLEDPGDGPEDAEE